MDLRGRLHRWDVPVETVDLDEQLAQFTEAPATYDELQRRPKFMANLDPKLHQLAEVLTPYTFSKEVPCGLTTCHQGHLHGFLVRTATGEETNIGHRCGKQHFGEDLEAANAAYGRLADRHDAVNRIRALREQAPAVRQQVHDLTEQPFGIRWLHVLVGSLKSHIGSPAFAHLVTRAKREDYVVSRVAERSEEDILQLMRSTGKKREQVRYIEEQVGRLPPLEWLYWDFREEVITGVGESFRLVGEVNPRGDTKRLNEASKACFGWEPCLALARKHLAGAKTFLGPDALEIADIALEEFWKDKAEPEAERGLVQWRDSFEMKSLMAGMAKTIQEAPAPVKFISKGKLRKRKKR